MEKELLSIVRACEKFHCFIFGHPQTVEVYNDHKPLEAIPQATACDTKTFTKYGDEAAMVRSPCELPEREGDGRSRHVVEDTRRTGHAGCWI